MPVGPALWDSLSWRNNMIAMPSPVKSSVNVEQWKYEVVLRTLDKKPVETGEFAVNFLEAEATLFYCESYCE